MGKVKRWLILYLMLTWIGGGYNVGTIPSARAATQPRTTELDLSRKEQQVDQLFASFIGVDEPGGAVLVMQKGKVLYKAAYGLANLKNKTPLTPQHLFHIGSVGKQFTALAVMMLVEAGKLKYDVPLRTYLPELPAWGERVTIRHLLHHTSGLPDYTDALLKWMYERSDTPDNEDLLAALAHIRLRSVPGAVFEYSNPGYDLLGLLVARVSGQKFADFMQQRIFAPLGMTRTFSLPHRGHLRLPLLAHSYTLDDNNPPVAYDSDSLDNLVGSGSLYSTVEEMALYDQALYTDTLVKQATLAEAFRSGVTNDGKKTDYGFGWEIERWQGKPYVAHSGAWLAFQSDYVRFPNEELSVIVLFNRDYNVPDEPRIGVQVARIDLK